tara:strand:- start:263 stop:1072 length:810 start_codon:yes stop_codon:yes gene_type:complete
MKKKNKYTIFGHSGFLGSNIVKTLREKKYSVFLPPRNKVKFSKNLNNVIYCIGSDDVLEDPINAIQSNLLILSKIILQNQFKKFIYVSSTRLYINSKNTNESDKIKINPNSKNYFYNSLKIAAENFCLSQGNKNIKVLRLSNLYGLNFKKQTYLLPTLIRNSKKNKKINIYINEKSKKNFLNIHDAIHIIVKIIKKSKYRLYNIASNKRISIEKIVSSIKKATNCKIIYSNQKEKFDEPKIDISRIKKEFKFKPNNNFDSFITDIIDKY